MDERIKRYRAPAARLSRRGFFNSAGAAGAGLFAASVLPGSAMADDDDDDRKGGHATGSSSLNALPNPIPHTAATPFGTTAHFFFPGPVEGTATATDPTGPHPNGRDPSLIFDFTGFIGQADLSFTGTGTDLNTGVKAAYNFNGDVRFMKGTYVGTDGKAREGTFAFI